MRPEPAALPRLPALLLLIPLVACSSSSEVAELSPDVYGLTSHGNTQAQAARVGVERARNFCTQQERAFEPMRSHIGGRDYTIAFRCPLPEPPPTLAEAPVFTDTPRMAEPEPLPAPALPTASPARATALY